MHMLVPLDGGSPCHMLSSRNANHLKSLTVADLGDTSKFTIGGCSQNAATFNTYV